MIASWKHYRCTLLPILLLLGLCFPTMGGTQPLGYRLYASADQFANLPQLQRIDLSGVSSVAEVEALAAEAAVATGDLASGQRGLLLLVGERISAGVDTAITQGQADWWQASAETSQALVEAFLARYAGLGGQLDLLSIDSSSDLSVAGLYARGLLQGDPDAYFNRLTVSPGFVPLAESIGLKDASALLTAGRNGEAHPTWDRLMGRRSAAWLAQVVVTPLQRWFPAAQVSVQGFYDQNAAFAVAPVWGRLANPAAQVGTHQSQLLLEGEPNPLSGNQNAPFDSLSDAIDRLRGMALASDRPIHPLLEGSLIFGSDSQSVSQGGLFYRELILHAGLSGVSDYLAGHSDLQDDQLLSATLSELQQRLGATGKRARIDSLIERARPFIITSAGNPGERLWRVTPRPQPGRAAQQMALSDYPALLSWDGVELRLPAALLPVDGDSAGLWLEERPGLQLAHCEGVTEGRYCLEYSGQDDPQGAPALALAGDLPASTAASGRQQLLDWDWGLGGPDAGVGRDGFSLRWIGSLNPGAGIYRAELDADDKVRLWLDGTPLIDAWDAPSPQRTLGSYLTLSEGYHQLRLDYQDLSGEAALGLALERVGCLQPGGGFCLEYFDGAQWLPLEQAQLQISDNGLRFSLGDLPVGVAVDGLLLRWSGSFVFAQGDYQFMLSHGARELKLSLDGQPLYQGSSDGGAVDAMRTAHLSQGDHLLALEYRLGSNAFLSLDWQPLGAELVNCASVPAGEFCAEYFANRNLEGDPALVRIDPQVNFDWGNGSADASLPRDNFSVRWQGDFQFDQDGSYNFQVRTDDGFRLWVDGEPVIDSWHGQAPTLHQKSLWLKAGSHRIRAEYFEAGGGAVAELSWAAAVGCGAIPQGRFCGAYYDNHDLAGDAALVREDQQIAFEWQDKAPAGGLGKDHFSVRWLGEFQFEAGEYNLHSYTDDGVRVWIGDRLLIDSWQHGGRINQVVTLPAGLQRVRVEYREWGGWARAHVSWELGQRCESVPNGAFCGEFFNNRELTGLPVHAANVPAIDFEWKGESPLAGVIGKDNFSARWQGDFTFTEGDYRFIARTDDGMRVWIDDAPIIDSWKPQAATEYFKDLHLAAGSHRIKVEYKEHGGWATAQFHWEQRHPCGGVPSGAFCGSYFNNEQLQGEPVRQEQTPAIAFDWGRQRPMHGVNPDRFSVRWEGSFNFDGGAYRFTSDVDDGIRLWIDDRQVIDAWSMDWSYRGKYSRLLRLAPGLHKIRMEYREAWSDARANLRWEAVPGCGTVPSGQFCAELFHNEELQGDPVDGWTEAQIAHDWGKGSPDNSKRTDRFSLRWQGDFTFEAGAYRFVSDADDSMRVWIDGEPIIDSWDGARKWPLYGKQHRLYRLTAGSHRVRVEYKERWGSARANFHWQRVAGCEAVPSGRFCAEFFGNKGLTGAPSEGRVDSAINFDWKSGAPIDGVWKDNFSVRWQGDFAFKASGYRFIATGDDGIRVWVDGRLIIDGWRHQRPTEYRAMLPLTAGTHRIKMEYFESGGGAVAKLRWEETADCSQVPEGQFCASFFATTDLSGDPVDSRLYDKIDFDWGSGNPIVGVGANKFSVRWEGDFPFAAGTYRFKSHFDDAMRVWIDGALVIDAWDPKWSWFGKRQVLRRLSAGNHRIKVEYREGWGNASVGLLWETAPSCDAVPSGEFCGEYFPNQDLSGEPLEASLDPAIDFDWQGGGPSEALSHDKFSARWQGDFEFEAGYYRFRSDADDGFRVWVDGDLIIDAWKRSWPWYGKQRTLLKLEAGTHRVKVEYYEAWGKAKAKLSWSKAPDCSVVPEGRFCGEFYEEMGFKGGLADTLEVDRLDFDWPNLPIDNIEHDTFSDKWVGDFAFEAGLYRFSALADDGVRVWLDDELIIDYWNQQKPTEYRAVRQLTQGKHRVRVEHFDGWGGAVLKVNWQPIDDCSPLPVGAFCAEYYNQGDLKGPLADIRQEPKIDFDWGGGKPLGVKGRDHFSARWSGAFDLPAGEYSFTSRTDDGVRLWVDDQLLIDAWRPMAPTEYSQRVFLDQGRHQIRMDYFEVGGGAVAQLVWQADQSGAPQAPAGLEITEQGHQGVTLAWQPHDLIGRYHVYRDGRLLGSVDANDYCDTQVEVGQAYRYAVKAVWPNGTESPASQVELTVPDTIPPGVPGALQVTARSNDSIALSWGAASDNIAVTGYRLLRNGEPVATVNATRFTDQGLQSFSHYSYQVIALDAAGNASPPTAALTVTTDDGTPPSVPTGLSVQPTDATSMQLSWQAATDNVGVSGYQVLRDGKLIARVASTSYSDQGLAGSSRYRYQIRALDAAGNLSSASQVVEVRTGDTEAPTTPSSLRAELLGNQSVRLSWGVSRDNQAVSGYRVIRDGRLIATAMQTEYTDSSAEAGLSYSYQVKAIDAAGNLSAASNPADVSLAAACAATESFFVREVAPHLERCASCHNPGGLAHMTRFVLHQGTDAASRNQKVVVDAANQLGGATLLEKSIGTRPHGGGAPFGDAQSLAYRNLAEFLRQLDDPAACGGSAPTVGDIPVAALVGNCAICHGSDGVSGGPAMPAIAGFDRGYFVRVMNDYQSGRRHASMMDRVAKGYSADQIAAMADYFAALPQSQISQSVDANLQQLGQRLHQGECESCHTNSGRDNGLTGVRLAGQWRPYLEAVLSDYLADRSQAPTAMRGGLDQAHRVDPQAVQALAHFYAGQAADTQGPDQPVDLALAATTNDSLTLTWTDADDNWQVTGYEIYRDGQLIATTRWNSFTDTGLQQGSYRYQILALDAAGNRSSRSGSLNLTLQRDASAPDGVRLLDPQATLRKASLLLLNRIPTAAERAAVDSDETLRQTLRGMMAGDALHGFAERAGFERFLSNGAAGLYGSRGLSRDDYPALTGLSRTERGQLHDAVRHQPVHLLSYIVDNERPWSEIVTADYTMANPIIGRVMGAEPISGSFAGEDQFVPARQARISARIDKPFPHAGVLTTHAWLSRFPTTDTNRNRHRSKSVFKQFLGIDIEALGQRPLDDSNNGDFLVPTLESPACLVCHTSMDPVAGAFQSWGTAARYQQNFNGSQGDRDSLPRAYKSADFPPDHNGLPWYRPGDAWYRDALPAGYGDQVMPGGHRGYGAATEVTDNLLQNPGAEQDVEGWVVDQGVLLASQAAGCGTIPAPYNGSQLFMLGGCGVSERQTLVHQDLSVARHAAAIDAGQVQAIYGAQLRDKGWSDRPEVYLEFLDAQGGSIGVSNRLRNQRPYWRRYTETVTLPRGTRTIRYWMAGLRRSGSVSDVYIDATQLRLQLPAVNSREAGVNGSLQWLGWHLVADPRFAKGGVHFWYRALFKRDPLSAPMSSTVDDYATRLAAYNQQDRLLEEIAGQFVRDQGHGPFNVKDLLVELVLSPLFRAASADGLDAQSRAELHDLGMARLLTPEELNHKLLSLTGEDWYYFRDGNAWRTQQGKFYGGFDGGSLLSQPNSQINSLMATIPERMAMELSCNIVRHDFARPVAERLLFGAVEAADTPDLDQLSGNNLLVNPGAEQGMVGWTLAQGTVQVWRNGERIGGCRGPGTDAGESYFVVGGICSGQSAIGEAYQEVDLSAQAGTIDQGGGRVLFGARLRPWSRNNDRPEVFVSFHAADGSQLAESPHLIGEQSRWQQQSRFVAVPVGTRRVRFHLLGVRTNTSQANNDAYIDDAYLQWVAPGDGFMGAGEQHIRQAIQHLHSHLLGEPLPLDDPEIDRTFQLFQAIWGDRENVSDSLSCSLNNRWQDPYYTKRAWAMVVLYLLGDARFLYE